MERESIQLIVQINDVQREMWVQVHNSLKVVTQLDRMVKKAYDVLAFVSQAFDNMNQEVIATL